jgi:pyruvate formate lyase activating enzyme
MADCKICGTRSPLVSKELAVCLNCIRERPQEALPVAQEAHRRSRRCFGLPEEPPKDPRGVVCNICVNQCRIPEQGTGYCGLRTNRGGKLTGVTRSEGKLSWYHDPLPTNCVGDWVCPGGTGAGYPKYAHRSGPEVGYRNLAVFFHACSFNCLLCQNWQFKQETPKPDLIPAARMVSDVDARTSCICYFGGDPAPQLPFSLHASRLALAESRGRILRICWETNGSMHPGLLDAMLDLALASGGCVKFDLKARDEGLHLALTGVTNRRTLENFQRAGERIAQRPVPPPLIANTLLIPGYIDEEEVRPLAKWIASIHPHIPYSLLAFHPQFCMSDLPLTSSATAHRCLQAARQEGLSNVRLGNVHLLT